MTNTDLQKKNEQEQKQSSIKCIACNDTGFIYNFSKRSYSKCNCLINDGLVRRLEKAGLDRDSINKTFSEYEPVSKEISSMKDKATGYVLSFDKIKNSKNNSLALLGESGAGKSHLIIAALNNFINRKNTDVQYISYPEEMTILKQSTLDGDKYQAKVDKYKNCELLVIDDLFKISHTDADVRIVFEIINHRYVKKKPVMVSSELTILDICNIDRALGGRLKEMTDKFRCEIKGLEHNYRMR